MTEESDAGAGSQRDQHLPALPEVRCDTGSNPPQADPEGRGENRLCDDRSPCRAEGPMLRDEDQAESDDDDEGHSVRDRHDPLPARRNQRELPGLAEEDEQERDDLYLENR